MKIRNAIVLFLTLLVSIACVACSKPEVQPQTIDPHLSQMKVISELAVLECYYHNVAKYNKEDAAGAMFWKKDKHFWIEYSGIVKVGIDASLIEFEVNDDSVTITIPPAEVLYSKVDGASLTKDSFIVDKDSAKVTAEDEIKTFAEAQDKMELAASNDKVLLENAQLRVKTLLEKYIVNLGDLIGKEYSIEWKYIPAK